MGDGKPIALGVTLSLPPATALESGGDTATAPAASGGPARAASGGPAAAGPAADPKVPLASLLVVAALTLAVLGQGAFYRTGQAMVLVLVTGAAIGATVVGHRRSVLFRGPLVGPCAALAAWSLVSAALAGDWTAALSTVLVLAGAVVVVSTCDPLEARQRDQLLVAVVAIGVLAALSGWAGVAWHRSPWALVDQGLWRAATTITYANAAAGLMAAVALVGLARAAGSAPSAPLAAANCVLLTGLGATLSRGGSLAFLAGALVLARLLGIGAVLQAAAGPALGAMAALAGLWPSIPASAPSRTGLAVGGLVVGLALAIARDAGGAGHLGLPSHLARAVAVAIPLTLTLAAVVLAGDASRDIARPRLTIASPDRVEEARAALRVAAGAPLTGAGPGRADLTWVRDDGSVAVARYAHNEYLQTLAELGVVGLGLLVSLGFVVARMLRRSRSTAPSPAAWAGVTAGLVALAAHGLFDFGWHLPAIPLTGALLVGIVTTKRKDQT